MQISNPASHRIFALRQAQLIQFGSEFSKEVIGTMLAIVALGGWLLIKEVNQGVKSMFGISVQWVENKSFLSPVVALHSNLLFYLLLNRIHFHNDQHKEACELLDQLLDTAILSDNAGAIATILNYANKLCSPHFGHFQFFPLSIYLKNQATPVLHKAIALNKISALRSLITHARFQDLNRMRDAKGLTPLCFAAASFQEEAFDLLLKKEASLESEYGTPLLFSLLYDSAYDGVEFLERKGLLTKMIKEKDVLGRTIIHSLIIVRNQEALEFILAKSKALGIEIDFNEKDGFDMTVFYYALIFQNAGMMKRILPYISDKNFQEIFSSDVNQRRGAIAHKLVVNGDLESLNLVLAKAKALGIEIDFHARDNDNYDALYVALALDKKDIIASILDYMSDESLKKIFNDDLTTLHFAASTGKRDVIKKVLSISADPALAINRMNKSGKNALYFAALSNSSEALDLLIQEGGDINFQDEDGDTLLHYLVKKHSQEKEALIEVITLLKTKGLNLQLRNKAGKTAFESLLELGIKDKELNALIT